MPDFERPVLIVNPNSSRSRSVESNVVSPLEEANIPFVIHKAKSPNSDDNIADMLETLRDGNRLVVASGDGVAHQAVNALLRSDTLDTSVGMLPMGGFNDMSATFNDTKSFHPAWLFDRRVPLQDVHTVDFDINGEHLRSAVLYGMLGWTGVASTIMDDPEIRAAVQSKSDWLKQTWMKYEAAKLYFNVRGDIPKLSYVDTDEPEVPHEGITDITFMNGPVAAQTIGTGKNYFTGDTFLMSALDTSSLSRCAKFLAISGLNVVIGTHLTVPGDEKNEADLSFTEPVSFKLQMDGEVFDVRDAMRLTARKNALPVKVVSLLKLTEQS